MNYQPEIAHSFSAGSYYILAVVAYLQEAGFSVVATIKVKAELVNLIPKSEKMCVSRDIYPSVCDYS